MRQLKTILTTFLVLCVAATTAAAAAESKSVPEIDELCALFHELENAHNDAQKDSINERILSMFGNFLQSETSFSANYDSLKHVSVVRADDKLLNVYTWNLCYKDASLKYFGFLQYKTDGHINVFPLNDQKYGDENMDIKSFTSNLEWFGSIYYEVVTKKWNNVTYYTLIGWDGADLYINRKIIDVLYFDRKNIACFGKKIFHSDKKNYGRLIFEYNEMATMLLRYNAKHDLIIMDHLTPSEQRYEHIYQYYGPDFSYDALRFRMGKWFVELNIDPDIAINYKRNAKVNNMKRHSFSKNF